MSLKRFLRDWGISGKGSDRLTFHFGTSNLRSQNAISKLEITNLSFEYVDVSAVSNELWKIMATTQYTGATAPSRARKPVQKQDVIFAIVRPTLKRVAVVPDHLDGQIVSTAFCVLRSDPIKAGDNR